MRRAEIKMRMRQIMESFYLLHWLGDPTTDKVTFLNAVIKNSWTYLMLLFNFFARLLDLISKFVVI